MPSIRTTQQSADFCVDWVEQVERVLPHLLDLWEAIVAYKANLIGDIGRDGVFIHQFYTAAPAEYGEAIDAALSALYQYARGEEDCDKTRGG